MITKTCSKCNLTLNLSNFNKRGDSNAYRSRCKQCESLSNSERNLKNKERLEYRKQYYLKNKERENLVSGNNRAKRLGLEFEILPRLNARPETLKEVSKRKIRDSYLKRTYGLTLLQYEEMLESQGNCCAICKGENIDREFSVDHCHTTGKIRSILCDFCNRGLGLFKDSEEILMLASSYLKKHKEEQ